MIHRRAAEKAKVSMSVLNRIAHFQNRRDEVPNQELARQLAQGDDREGIREIAENLQNKNSNIQADCIKVLYEIGYLKPELVAGYADDFIRLLKSRNNRLVWGGMIALSSVARLAAEALEAHIPEIQKAMERGSVITVDAGVAALAGIAATGDERRRRILPYLLEHLSTCRPKDVPQHAEKTLPAVGPEGKKAFIGVLEKRLEDLNVSQTKRVKKVIKDAEKL
jgi:hypothetical protein